MSLVVLIALGPTVGSTWGAAVVFWLVAHQATLITPDGAISLLPIGLAVIPLPLWRRASRWLEVQYSSRQGARRRAIVLSIAVYVAMCMAGALSVRSSDFRVSVLGAGIGAAAIVVIGMVWGIRRQAAARLRLPRALAGGVVAVAWFLAVGSVIVALSVVFSAGEIGAARQALAEDAVGQLSVLAVELAYLPNLIIWAAAYATGAGLSIGGDQHISMFSADQALVPDLPVLAAIPAEAPAWAALLPMLIVVGGWLSASIAQRQAPLGGLRRRLARAAFLAVMVLVFWFVAAVVSGGSLGDGRLDYVGPAPSTPLIAAALIGLGATIWALIPTLTSDARPLASALRGQFDRQFRMPEEAGTADEGGDVSTKPRVDAVSR